MSDSTTPPSPDGVALLGNGYAFARDPLAAYERWAAYGDVVSLSVPGRRLYLVSDPDLIESVLLDRDRFELSETQREAFAGLEDRAITATRGREWRRLRSALQPAFARESVDRYADGMVASVAARVDRWDDDERFDLHREMRLLSLDVLTDTLLDVDVDGHEDVLLDAADATIARADLRRPGQMLPDWVPTPTDRRFRRTVRELDDFVESVIDARLESGVDAAGSGTDEPSGEPDVASVLLAAHDRGDLAFAELRDNLVALLLGGHDTTAAAFTYAWYLLSRHPEERQRLVDEYETIVETGPTDGDDRPTAPAVEDLEYARRVVDETLRLYPPAPATARQTTEAVVLGGYHLPAGAQVLCPQWACHRDDRFWNAPEAFDPSRWTGDADHPEYAYFPFGGGPRHCIGMAFARQELILGLATMVGRCSLHVSADEPLSLVPSLTLRPESELTATVRKRTER